MKSETIDKIGTGVLVFFGIAFFILGVCYTIASINYDADNPQPQQEIIIIIK